MKYGRLSLFAMAALLSFSTLAPGQDYLWPDLTPLVREDLPYLADWIIEGDQLRVGTAVANVGLGILQIRTDEAGTGGVTTPVIQRVFRGTDNGPLFEDFPVDSVVNFHHTHGHIHFEDFAEFALYEVLEDDSHVEVGPLASSNIKASFNLVDFGRVPDPEWADAPTFPSSNRGRFQNISVGWFDFYGDGVDGQFVPIDGLEPGVYWLRQTIDPSNLLREVDESNNSFELLIDLASGETIRKQNGAFVRPGDFFPLLLGDLNTDGVIDIEDWIQFRDAADSDLTGLEERTLYELGDLNFDGQHSPADFLLFKQYFDAAHGSGALAGLIAAPEPTAFSLLLLVAAFTAMQRRR